jgi:hypothetical protein
MKEIIEQIKEKVKNCDETNKEGRARKGAYIDCITMIKEIRQCSDSGRNAVLADVRAELLHDAMGLLMNHKQHEDKGWKKDYEELNKKYSKHFS